MTIFTRELEVIKFGSPTPKNEWKQEMARQGKNVVITPKDSRLQSKIMHNPHEFEHSNSLFQGNPQSKWNKYNQQSSHLAAI